MEERDRIHEAYDKTDGVANQRHAQAAAMAEQQAARAKAVEDGGPSPDELELERQKKGIRIQKLLNAGVAGEDIEAALAEQDAKLAGRDKRTAHQQRKAAIPTDMMDEAAAMVAEGAPIYSDITQSLAAAVGEAMQDGPPAVARWERGGETVIRWGITTADDGAGAQIGFSVQVDGQEPGVILLDLDEKRIDTWSRGLQNADGPKRFAFGIVQKTFEVAAMETAQLLLGAIQEVQEGLHLPQDNHVLPQVDNLDDAEADDYFSQGSEDDPPPMSDEARAFLQRNAMSQGGPVVESFGATPEEIDQAGQKAQDFLEKNLGDAE